MKTTRSLSKPFRRRRTGTVAKDSVSLVVPLLQPNTLTIKKVNRGPYLHDFYLNFLEPGNTGFSLRESRLNALRCYRFLRLYQPSKLISALSAQWLDSPQRAIPLAGQTGFSGFV